MWMAKDKTWEHLQDKCNNENEHISIIISPKTEHYVLLKERCYGITVALNCIQYHWVYIIKSNLEHVILWLTQNIVHQTKHAFMLLVGPFALEESEHNNPSENSENSEWRI